MKTIILRALSAAVAAGAAALAASLPQYSAVFAAIALVAGGTAFKD